uniref:Uncharacterized protein n=1 Tax=Romanomermis culicivorax TaxID=13658 RepID=A0A915KJP3_ROMCU
MDVDLMVFMVIFGVFSICFVLWALSTYRKSSREKRLSSAKHCWCTTGQMNFDGTRTDAAAAATSKVAQVAENIPSSENLPPADHALPSTGGLEISQGSTPSLSQVRGRPPPSYIDVMNAFWESQGYCPIEVSPRYNSKLQSTPKRTVTKKRIEKSEDVQL